MAQQHPSTNQVLAIILDTKTFSNSHTGTSQYQNNNKPTVGVTMAMTDHNMFQKAESMHLHETNIDLTIESTERSPNSPSEEDKKDAKIMSIKKRSFPYRYHQRARGARGVNSRTKRIANSLQFPSGPMAPSDGKENPDQKAQQIASTAPGAGCQSNDAPQAGPNYQQQSSHTFMSMWVGIASMFRSKSASETQDSCPDGVGNSVCARTEYPTDNSGSQNSPETDQSQMSPTRLNVLPSQISSSQISASTLSECSTVRMETVKNRTKLRGKSLHPSESNTVSKDETRGLDKPSADNGQSTKREMRLRERGSPVDPKRLRLVLRNSQKHIDEEKGRVSGSKRRKSGGAQKNKSAVSKHMKLQGSPMKFQDTLTGNAMHSIIKPNYIRNKSPELYLPVDYQARSRSFDKKLFPGNVRGEERFEPIAIYRRNQSTPALAVQATDDLTALAQIVRRLPNEDNCRGAPSTLCWMGDEFPIPPHYSPGSHKRVQFNTSYPRALEPAGSRELTSLYPGRRQEAKSSPGLPVKQRLRYKLVDNKVGRAMSTASKVSPLRGLPHAGSSQMTYLQYTDRALKTDNASRSFPNIVKSSSDEAEKCIRKRITKKVSNPIYKRQRRSASQPDKCNSVQYRSSPSACSLVEF